MSDEEIRVGDIVWVAEACCERRRAHIGLVYTVSGFRSHSIASCKHCGSTLSTVRLVIAGESGLGIDHAPEPWVRKIRGAGELGLDGEGNDLEVDDKRPVADYA